MPWLKFTDNYNYKPTPGSCVAYKAGMVLNVPTRAAVLAIAAGKAVRMRKTRKDEEPVEWPQSGKVLAL